MAGASFGKKAAELVREIVECDPETLPPYNANAMRTLSEQCRDNHGEMASLAHILGELQGEEAKDESEEAAAAREDRIGAARVGMLAHHQVRWASTLSRALGRRSKTDRVGRTRRRYFEISGRCWCT